MTDSFPGLEDKQIMSSTGPTQLTAEVLVIELQKLSEGLKEEFNAALSEAMAPILSTLESITNTVATHTATISQIESTLSSHSDDIVGLQKDVATLKNQLASVSDDNSALHATVEDLISRSKRQNLRVVGIPEDVEGANARQFMSQLFKEVAGDVLPDSGPELDRAHRSLRPRPSQGSRPIIVRFHRYVEKEQVLKWAKEHREMSYRGHRINFYEDFSATVAKKTAAFNNGERSAIRHDLPRPAESHL